MKSLVLFTFIALGQARFGQENIPIAAIRQVQGGSPGVSDTIAGAAISDLLAGADPCAKLQRGDQILSELGEGSDAVAAAIGMVAAEKNFNPFSASQPSICNDPSLPQNALLRGITPKIDPAVGGADVANALSAQTVSSPLQANGKSIADLLTENGFTNFTTAGAKTNANSAQSGNGAAKNAPGADHKAAATANATASGAAAAMSPAPASPSKAIGNDTVADPGTPPAKAVLNETLSDRADATPAPADRASACTCTCAIDNAAAAKANATASAAASASTTAGTGRGKKEKGAAAATTSAAAKKEKSAATSATSAAAASATDKGTGANNNESGKGMVGNNNGAGPGTGSAATGAEDFGSCDPTMSFQAGRAGRKATEFTFQSNDPVIAANQQDALNPNIITNRICDELTNICNANAAAKATCLSAKAQIQALGTRDQSTADAWNALVAGAAARRSRRRA